jgi:glyoxylase-like metal-dependent hydrolase (beta-lactamase superfamily II)
MKFDLGKRIVYAKYFGYAHERSDIALWVPKEKILFAGDLAFNSRLLPIFKITDINKWLQAWSKLEKLKAKKVVPGHGFVTNMKIVSKYTKEYLEYLKNSIASVIDNDGDLVDAYNIDMREYEELDLYKELGKQNISRVFKKMEFE